MIAMRSISIMYRYQQAFDRRVLCTHGGDKASGTGSVVRRERLPGLINEFARAA